MDFSFLPPLHFLSWCKGVQNGLFTAGQKSFWWSDAILVLWIMVFFSDLSKETDFSGLCLNFGAAQHSSVLCYWRSSRSLFLPFCLCLDCSFCHSLPLLNPILVPGYQSSLQSTLGTVVCVWSSCYMRLWECSLPKKMEEVQLGNGNAVLEWAWETASLWVCSMYCFYGLCPKYLAVRQCFNS